MSFRIFFVRAEKVLSFALVIWLNENIREDSLLCGSSRSGCKGGATA